MDRRAALRLIGLSPIALAARRAQAYPEVKVSIEPSPLFKVAVSERVEESVEWPNFDTFDVVSAEDWIKIPRDVVERCQEVALREGPAAANVVLSNYY